MHAFEQVPKDAAHSFKLLPPVLNTALLTHMFAIILVAAMH